MSMKHFWSSKLFKIITGYIGPRHTFLIKISQWKHLKRTFFRCLKTSLEDKKEHFFYTLGNDSNHSFDCNHKQCSNNLSIFSSHQDLRKKENNNLPQSLRKIRSHGIHTIVSRLIHEPIILSSLNLKGSWDSPLDSSHQLK